MAAPKDENLSRFDLKCLVCHRSALDACEDNTYAIGTSTGIYLVDASPCPSSSKTTSLKLNVISNSLLSTPVIPKFCFTYNNAGISTTQWKPDTFDDEFLVSINTHVRAQNKAAPQVGLSVVRWAPMDLANRSILAGLTEDHSVFLLQQLSRHKHIWSCVCDISKKYVDQERDNNWRYCRVDLTNNDLRAFQVDTGVTECVSAVVLEWSPIFGRSDTRQRFAVLTVAMKNSDVVFWKVPLPYSDSMAVTYLTTETSIKANVTCLRWSPGVKRQMDSEHGWLALGTCNGQISLMTVIHSDADDSIAVLPPVFVWSDDDMIQPTCLAWTHLVADLAWSFPLFYLVIIVSIISYHRGAMYVNWMLAFGTEICLDLQPIALTIDTISRWMYQGCCLSPNCIYITVVAMFVVILPNPHTDAAAIAKKYISTQDSSESIYSDVYEYIRRCVVSSTHLPDILGSLTLPQSALRELPMNHLKLLRYALITEKHIHKYSQKDSTHEEIQSTEERIDYVTSLLLMDHVRKTVEPYAGISPYDASQLPQRERSCLDAMCRFWEEKSSQYDWSTVKYTASTSQLIVLTEQVQKYTKKGFAVTDDAGHTFGACSLSFLACDTTDCRTCSTCLAPYLSLEALSEFSSRFPLRTCSRCILCDGFIKT